ncbi:Uncharacterized protein GcM3_006025 [Golovinomyces cichoracearum]|uniref:HAUS augmin-like complex subunit 4 n=1 Tax=Golovinomyces cichoracearum TaxID=62708 RepID=A0A420JAS9_9PEZI|nr:Uncharacterized protein GcM3_006025 [Golovinomyces cichoracearum]
MQHSIHFCIMFPPIEDEVLQKNPNFASLHKILTENILNADGTTRAHPRRKERKEVTTALLASQFCASKTYLLRTAPCKLDLSTIKTASSNVTGRTSSPSKQLPSELIESIILLSDRLATCSRSKNFSSDSELLENTSQWSSITNLAPKIGSLLSTHFQSQALALCRIENPNDDTLNTQQSIQSLVPRIKARQVENEDKKNKLDLQRLDLVRKVKILLSLYNLASNLVILHLEKIVHGSMALEMKARSEYLCLAAQKLELEAKEKFLRGEKIFYTEAVNHALENYLRSIRKGIESLEERKMDAERSLRGYGLGNPESSTTKVMRSIAENYAELQREIDEVIQDIERLQCKSTSHR